MEDTELRKVIETLLFITDEPLKAEKIARICEVKDVKEVEQKLEEIKHSYDMENRALAIMKVAGGWQMATRPEYAIWVRKLYQTRLTMRLSKASMEVLSIIAYKQPITRAEIEVIRGVDVIGPLETLIEKKLITTSGRKDAPGRPMLYITTNEFLRQFGLNSLDDLPKLDTVVSKESIEIVQKKIEEKIENKESGKFSSQSEKVQNEQQNKQNKDIINEELSQKEKAE
jgi:segregation and condensation protein B